MRALELLKCGEQAIKELKGVSFSDTSLWSMRWLTTVCILRAILHVSKEYDFGGSGDPGYNAHWDQKKQESIFKDFINSERNLAIKKFKIFENKKQEPFFICSENGDNITDEDGNFLIGDQKIILLDGENVYDLLDQAIVWIENYINEAQTKFPHLLRSS